jgi:hypothetical protein
MQSKMQSEKYRDGHIIPFTGHTKTLLLEWGMMGAVIEAQQVLLMYPVSVLCM